MPRARTRTADVDLDVITAINGLFGTVMNAHRCLGLEGLVTYNQLIVALKMRPVQPREKEVIEAAWERWREIYLRPEVPPRQLTNLVVEDTWLENLPDWHPDTAPAPRRKKAAR